MDTQAQSFQTEEFLTSMLRNDTLFNILFLLPAGHGNKKNADRSFLYNKSFLHHQSVQEKSLEKSHLGHKHATALCISLLCVGLHWTGRR